MSSRYIFSPKLQNYEKSPIKFFEAYLSYIKLILTAYLIKSAYFHLMGLYNLISRPNNDFKFVRHETSLDYQNSHFSCSNSISKTLDKPAYTHSLFSAYWALSPSVYT